MQGLGNIMFTGNTSGPASGSITGGHNGVSISTLDPVKLSLGNDVGSNLADLLDFRLINLNSFGIILDDIPAGNGEIVFSSGDISILRDGNAGNTSGPRLLLQEQNTGDPSFLMQTRSGLRIDFLNSILWLYKAGNIVYRGITGASDAIEDSADVTLRGSVVMRKKVTDLTDGSTPFTGQGNYVFSNIATAVSSDIALGACPIGSTITLTVFTAVPFSIAGAGATLYVGSSVTAVGGSVTSNIPGSSITFVQIDDVNKIWIATAITGTWTV